MLNIEYRCPNCYAKLTHRTDVPNERWSTNEALACGSCEKTYPIIAGIPDLRVYADPYIDIDADREKGLKLAARAEHLSFAEVVKYYYSITPEVPDDLGQYYLNHHLAGVTRGAGLLKRLDSQKLYVPSAQDRILDVGCGTAGFLAAAAPAGSTVIGADVAFRWLIVGRKRLQEMGLDATLVCACADRLPFAPDYFDLVVAENLIEHVKDQRALFAEIARVRKPKSAFYARTVNRFAFGPEPHVGVWGVGYLPRALQNTYVKAIKKIPYEHIYLQSINELRDSISQSHQSDLNVGSAKLAPEDYRHHGSLKRKLFGAYSTAAKAPVLGSAITAVGPYLDITSAPKDARVKVAQR